MADSCNSVNRDILRCQYWVEDEPVLCKYWDVENTICRYRKDTTVADVNITLRAPLFPLCNYIGTARDNCINYEPITNNTDNIYPRCVLPDPYRSTAKSICYEEVWVEGQKISLTSTVSGTGDPLLERPLDYSKINGYNGGKCDYLENDPNTGGTNPTCSGFKAHHLGMSGDALQYICTISGTDVECLPHDTDLTFDTTISGLRLPLSYVVANLRSDLAICRWWDIGSDTEFTLCLYNDKVQVVAPKFACTCPDYIVNEYSKFKYIKELQYYRPPCNGSMPDCPRYTGNLVTSLGDKPFTGSTYLRYGDKVLADQILELRYNMRKERWTKDSYKDAFDFPIIYAWTSDPPEVIYGSDNTILDYTISTIKTYISDFENFNVCHSKVLLTKGNQSDNLKPDYPTLVKYIKKIPLKPIIRSTFDPCLNINNDSVNMFLEEGKVPYLPTVSGTPYEGNNTDCYVEDALYNYLWNKNCNIFETTKLNHEYILLVGDTFYHNNTIFAINLSDPDIVFPFSSIFNFDSIQDMYNEYVKKQHQSKVFDEFYNDLECYLEFLQNRMADHLYYSEFNGVNNNAFYIKVKTYFGINDIVVFDNCGGTIWEFDRIVINKVFCGGVLAQTSFKLHSTDKDTDAFFNYEKIPFRSSFDISLNYQYKSFMSSSGTPNTVPILTYLDGKLNKPIVSIGDKDTFIITYNTYKIKIMSFVLINDIKFIGNDGYVLVTIDDVARDIDGFAKPEKLLHAVIRPWEIEGDIILKGELYDCTEIEIPMEVHVKCVDYLPINQMILKPKNKDYYRRIYNCFILLKGIYIFERYSFGSKPDKGYSYEIIDEKELGDDTTVIRHLGELACDVSKDNTCLKSGDYTLTQLPNAPLIASVVFKSTTTGRVVGQVKSELFVWIKHIFCSDVEIKYTWSANYEKYELLPTGYCFTDDIDTKFIGTEVRHYTPYCGDHYFGIFNKRPSWMWYPYDTCDDFATYDINEGTGEYDAGPMEFWLNSQGNWEASPDHGYFDLRMLGPADNFGTTTDVHLKIWDCGCDYTHTNYKRSGDIFFDGSARIRTAIPEYDMYYVKRNGGVGPKFGNKYRDYMLSYRSSTVIYYPVLLDSGLSSDFKWPPIYETFYDITYSDSYKEYPFRQYFNVDDNICVYYPQIGVLFSESLDGIDSEERFLVDDDDNLLSFRFDEIIKPHISWSINVEYPKPRVTYIKGFNPPKTSSAWYTYKDIPVVGYDNLAINSIWRLPWKSIERSIDYNLYDVDDWCKLTDKSNLQFINIQYLNYTYDYSVKEFRRVTNEGIHVLNWYASIESDSDPYRNMYFLVGLDDSGYRLLDYDLKLIKDPAIPLNFSDPLFDFISNDTLSSWVESYNYCDNDRWLNEVSASTDLEAIEQDSSYEGFIIYDSTNPMFSSEGEAISLAENDNRVVKSTDGMDEVVKYFNQGLYLSIYGDMLPYVPKDVYFLNPNAGFSYDVALSKPSDDDSQYSVLEPGIYYNASVSFECEFNEMSGDDVIFKFKFHKPFILDSIDISVREGIKQGDDYNTFYIIPDTSIYIGSPFINTKKFVYKNKCKIDDDTSSLVLAFCSFDHDEKTMDYYNTKIDYVEIHLKYVFEYDDVKSIVDNYVDKFSVYGDIDPKEFYEACLRSLYLANIKFNGIKFIDFMEQFETYERKFFVSVNEYGNIPIHGKDTTGSLLYPSNDEPTVYQKDNSTGMLGWPNSNNEFKSISKQRSRFAGPIKEDKLPIDGDYPDYELMQSKIYNKVIEYNENTSIRFTSILHELLKDEFKKAGITIIPKWECVMDIDTPIRLKDVKPRSKYNPPGHKWTWDTRPGTIKRKYNCGGSGKGKWKTVFEYAWGRVSNMYGYSYETDVFDLFSYGVINIGV